METAPGETWDDFKRRKDQVKQAEKERVEKEALETPAQLSTAHESLANGH